MVFTLMQMNLIADFLIRGANQKLHCLIRQVWSLLCDSLLSPTEMLQHDRECLQQLPNQLLS